MPDWSNVLIYNCYSKNNILGSYNDPMQELYNNLNMQVMKEKQPVRTVNAKFASSQTKYNGSLCGKASKEIPGTSLFEILKRSSEQPSVRNRDDSFDLTPLISTFKIPKKPFKMGGRS